MVHLPDPGPIVIIGAGGFGRECLDIVEALNDVGAGLEFVGFVDDGEPNRELLDARNAMFLGGTADATIARGVRYVIGVGSGTVRAQIAERLDAREVAACTLVHPTATMGSVVSLAEGIVMCAGVRITTNVSVGAHTHLNLNVTVGHDSNVGAFVSVFPGVTISGNVTIGDRCTVGTGANILPGVSIGAGAYVGAGAVVVTDVDPETTVVGVPARPLAR